MCFSGGNRTPTPTPTYPTRFEYNRPVPNQSETERRQNAQASTTGTFGAELGSSPSTPKQTTGGY